MDNLEQNEIPSVAVSASFREIPDNENFKRKDEIVGPGQVRSTFAVRMAEGEQRYEVTTIFDFRDCEPDEVALLSLTNGCVVWLQRNIRECGIDALTPANWSHVDVKDQIIEAPARVVADPVERARRAVAKLSPEARAAILADYVTADTE